MGAAAAGGWMSVEPSAGSARAAGLAEAAGVPKAARAGKPRVAENSGLVSEGLVVGFLPGSAELLEYAAMGRALGPLASRMRWARWDASLSRQSFESRADVSIGVLQRAQGAAAAPGMLRALEVVAHFALDDAPYFAPFGAWRYEAAGLSSKHGTATSPLTFDAAMPDRVGLQVNYSLSAAMLAPGTIDSGMVYLPLGARDGPGFGLYVLAGPSHGSGAQPDLSDYFFSGDLRAPLLRSAGSLPDFDFVTLTVRRAAA